MTTLYVLTYEGKVVAPLGQRVAAYRSYSLADRGLMSRAGKNAFDRWQEGRYGDYLELYEEELKKFAIQTFQPGGNVDDNSTL